MLPAWTATSGNLVDALKDGTPGAGGSRRRVRAALVVVQVALSVVLLAAAGLCVRSLINARTIRTGFNTSGVLLASLDLYPHATSNEVVRNLYRSLLDRVGRAPGVSAVTMASTVPLGLDSGSWTTHHGRRLSARPPTSVSAPPTTSSARTTSARSRHPSVAGATSHRQTTSGASAS